MNSRGREEPEFIENISHQENRSDAVFGGQTANVEKIAAGPVHLNSFEFAQGQEQKSNGSVLLRSEKFRFVGTDRGCFHPVVAFEEKGGEAQGDARAER